MLIIGLILINLLFQSCVSKTERELKEKRLEKRAVKILDDIKDEIKFSNKNNSVVWRPDMEKIEQEWYKIHCDSAELGLQFATEFDSLFDLNTLRIKEQAKAERKQRETELTDKLKDNYNKWMGR